MENFKTVLESVLQVSNRTYSQRTEMKAFLEHYAAFVESQTGIPKEQTLQEIKEKTKENMPDFRKQIAEILLNSLEDPTEL